MSEVTEVLIPFFKSIEYSVATNLSVSKIERDLYYLLKSHAVIDKETAEEIDEFLTWHDADKSEEEYETNKLYAAYDLFHTELSRITKEPKNG